MTAHKLKVEPKTLRELKVIQKDKMKTVENKLNSQMPQS